MIRSRWPGAVLLLALATPAPGQGLPGSPIANPGGFAGQGARKSGEDLLMPSTNNPGVAPPLDIRIQGEGLSLPKGVSEDDRPASPAPEAAPPRREQPQPAPSKPPPQ